jgi:hypothetical protein
MPDEGLGGISCKPALLFAGKICTGKPLFAGKICIMM